MKKIFHLSCITAVAILLIVSCKDTFNESDFLNFQLKQKNKQDSLLAAKNADAFNKAGQLLSYTLQVTEDKGGVPGVAVVMSNPPAGTTTSTLTATTDANGFATFANVVIGANTFVISKTGYNTATFIVDFGTVNSSNYQIINNTVIPIKKSASNQVPIFPNGGTGATATVKGKVTIETDLTNNIPEVPQNLTITANLIGVITNLGGSSTGTANGQGTIQTYFFNAGGVGNAKVDNTTGAYSMTVPASADGRTIGIIVPTLDGTQKIAIQRLAGQNISPVYRTVPTTWGAINSSGYDAIPAVVGAFANFSAPPPPGQGANFTFATPVARSLETGTMTNPAQQAPYTAGVNTLGNTIYYLSNRGATYSSSPSFTLTGGGATTQATMLASLIGTSTGGTLGNGGSGYTGTVTFSLQLTPDNTNYYTVYDINSNPVTFTKDVGASPTAITQAMISAVPTSGGGFDPSIPLRTSVTGTNGFGVQGFRWSISGSGSGATATANVSCSLDQVKITNGGSGYTSAPTISIFGNAVISVVEFGTQWNVSINNSANNPSYSILPAAIAFQFNSLVGGGNFISNSVVDQFGTNTASLINALTVSGGNIVWQDASKTYKTGGYSPAAPIANLTLSTQTMASANVTISSTSSTYGQITGLSSVIAGAGYNAPITISILPTIAGAPGSGGKIDLTNITLNASTKQYSWAGGANWTLSSPGNGYLPFLNAYYTNYPALSFPTSSIVNMSINGANAGTGSWSGTTYSFIVKTGETQVYDIVYGTGQKKENVN